MKFMGKNLRVTMLALSYILVVFAFMFWVSAARAVDVADQPDTPSPDVGGIDGGGPDAGVRIRKTIRGRVSTRSAPTGYVVSDDACSGGKFNTCE